VRDGEAINYLSSDPAKINYQAFTQLSVMSTVVRCSTIMPYPPSLLPLMPV
jgi:hypothetical protein